MAWIGLFLAPAVFFVHLQLGYVMIPWACTHHQDFWVHAVGVGSVILAMLGCFAAWRAWMRGGHTVPGDQGGATARTRMLGAVGLGMSVLLTMILFMQWVAAFFIGTCQ